MTKTNGLLIAAFLMATTSPMAIGQTSEPTPLPGSSPSDIMPAPMPGDQADETDSNDAGDDTGDDTGTASDRRADRENMDFFVIIAQLSLPSAADVDWQTAFSDLPEDSDVTIVTLSTLADADDPAAPMLDQAMVNFDNDRDNLRRAITQNEALRGALDQEGYANEDVVAALMDQTGDGSITLVVDAEAQSDGSDADDTGGDDTGGDDTDADDATDSDS
jgi:hypothetical protein